MLYSAIGGEVRFKDIISNIELFLNVAKNCVRLNKIHQFTKESVLKKVIRAFHLTSELIKYTNYLIYVV